MRISFIINTLGPGGAERQLYYLVKGLKQRSIDCQVIYSKGKQHYVKEFRALGVNIRYIDTGNRGKYSAYLFILRETIKAAKFFKPDILQSFSPATHIIAAICGLLTHIDVILCERNINIPMSIFARAMRISLYRYAFCLICNSVAVQNWSKRQYLLPKNKTRVIPNGVALSVSHLRENMDNKMHQIVLTIAQFRPQKGYIYLIHAIREVLKWYNAVRFIAVGEGAQRNEMKELARRLNIEDAIAFENNTSNIEQYYERADIFCLPSLSEGMPNVVMEAMAHGLPVVATNVGGTSELIKDEHSGLLVRAGTAHDLASVIVRLLKDKELRLRLGGNAHSEIKNFGIDICTGRYVSLYSATQSKNNNRKEILLWR